MEDTNNLKLKIELVPATSWYSNLRKVLQRNDWNKLRKQIYVKYDHKCGVCNVQSRLNCHEIWTYNDQNYRQKLDGFIALCNLCHHIKHIGLAEIMADQGRLNYDNIVKHFMKVNNCDRIIFEKHKQEAFKKWEERSKHEWEIDLGEYKALINQSSPQNSSYNNSPSS